MEPPRAGRLPVGSVRASAVQWAGLQPAEARLAGPHPEPAVAAALRLALRRGAAVPGSARQLRSPARAVSRTGFWSFLTPWLGEQPNSQGFATVPLWAGTWATPPRFSDRQRQTALTGLLITKPLCQAASDPARTSHELSFRRSLPEQGADLIHERGLDPPLAAPCRTLARCGAAVPPGASWRRLAQEPTRGAG